jgi:pentatricopeptide repeat protein
VTRPGIADAFTRKKVPKVSRSRKALFDALDSHDDYGLVEAYENLLLTDERLSANDITKILDKLAGNKSPVLRSFRESLWSELAQQHDVQPSRMQYRSMIIGTARFGDTARALQLTRELYAMNGYLDEFGWSALATSAASNDAALDRNRLISQTIRAAKDAKHPTDKFFAALIKPLIPMGEEGWKNIDWIAGYLGQAKTGYSVQTQFVAAHLARDAPQLAQRIVSAWPPLQDITDPQLAREMGECLVNVELDRLKRLTSESSNTDSLIKLLRSLPFGYDLSPQAFSFLLDQHVRQSKPTPRQFFDGIDKIISATGRGPSQKAWQTVVSERLPIYGVETTFEIYDAATRRGQFVSAGLARQLITSLYKSNPLQFTEAIRVYDDLAAMPEWDSIRYEDPAIGEIFFTLLRACARADPPAPRVAIELAEAARDSKVTFPAKDLTSLIGDIMTASHDHPEAYDVYAALVQLAATPLNHRQYSHILSTFILLDFPTSNVAPADYVLDMFKDMRRAGHHPDAPIVTSLLTSYATLAKKITRNRHKLSVSETEFSLDALQNAINDIYRLISLDPEIQVDVPLLVSLMAALSTVNAYADAMEVWDDIVRNRAPLAATVPHEQVQAVYGTALSVAFDTCGFADLCNRAKKIWLWGNRHNLVDRPAWSAYAECLCRCGRYNEAIDLLSKEMREVNLDPTLDEITMIVRFAFRTPQAMPKVRARIQEAFPEIWEEIREALAEQRIIVQ